MRWVLLLALILNPIVPALAQEEEKPMSLVACDAKGKRAAGDVSTGGSFLGGFAGGLFLGLIGTGIAVVVQPEPHPPYHRLPDGDKCSYAFQRAYANKGKSKKRSAALQGGLLGTLVLVVVVVATQN